jgi:hypothetical protein
MTTLSKTAPLPRGSKEFECKLNRAAAAGVQDAIGLENCSMKDSIKDLRPLWRRRGNSKPRFYDPTSKAHSKG